MPSPPLTLALLLCATLLLPGCCTQEATSRLDDSTTLTHYCPYGMTKDGWCTECGTGRLYQDTSVAAIITSDSLYNMYFPLPCPYGQHDTLRTRGPVDYSQHTLIAFFDRYKPHCVDTYQRTALMDTVAHVLTVQIAYTECMKCVSSARDLNTFLVSARVDTSWRVQLQYPDTLIR